MERYDVVIIGQGYAGMVAAKAAADKGLKAATFETGMPGGLIMGVNDLDPPPAGDIHAGPELSGEWGMAVMDAGVASHFAGVHGIARDGAGWRLNTDEGEVAADHVILATGARLRKLGVPGEEEMRGRGVSECADCDGPMFGGRDAVVVGGGDAAYQEALALTHHVAGVTLILRGEAPRARADLVAKVAACPAVTVITGTQVVAINGNDKGAVSGVRLKGADGAERDLDCAAVFAFIGLDPASEIAPDGVVRDASGAIVVDGDGATGLSGLWAIGAVRAGFGGSLDDAAQDALRVVAAIG